MEMRSQNIWGFWGTFLWGVVITLLLFVGQILPLYLYRLFQGKHDTLDSFFLSLDAVEQNAFLLSLSIIGSALFVVPLVLGMAKLKRNSSLRDYFAFNPISWGTMGRWMLVLLALLVFESFAIEALGVEEIPSFMLNIEYPSVLSMWVLLFAVIFMAPLVEEIVFRGFLLKGFSQTFMGYYGAIVVTSLLWAMSHMQYELAYVAVIFVVGLVFGYARLKTNSILTPLIMHFFMNLVATVGLFVEKGMV
jgi:membrane protease YdiL (CAAX protease family)